MWHSAFMSWEPAGNPWRYQEAKGLRSPSSLPRPHDQGGLQTDTSYTCVVDRWGNAFSATPSDGFAGSPIVPKLGFIISSRGSQTWLDPEHPCARMVPQGFVIRDEIYQYKQDQYFRRDKIKKLGS